MVTPGIRNINVAVRLTGQVSSGFNNAFSNAERRVNSLEREAKIAQRAVDQALKAEGTRGTRFAASEARQQQRISRQQQIAAQGWRAFTSGNLGAPGQVADVERRVEAAQADRQRVGAVATGIAQQMDAISPQRRTAAVQSFRQAESAVKQRQSQIAEIERQRVVAQGRRDAVRAGGGALTPEHTRESNRIRQQARRANQGLGVDTQNLEQARQELARFADSGRQLQGLRTRLRLVNAESTRLGNSISELRREKSRLEREMSRGQLGADKARTARREINRLDQELEEARKEYLRVGREGTQNLDRLRRAAERNNQALDEGVRKTNRLAMMRRGVLSLAAAFGAVAGSVIGISMAIDGTVQRFQEFRSQAAKGGFPDTQVVQGTVAALIEQGFPYSVASQSGAEILKEQNLNLHELRRVGDERYKRLQEAGINPNRLVPQLYGTPEGSVADLHKILLAIEKLHPTQQAEAAELFWAGEYGERLRTILHLGPQAIEKFISSIENAPRLNKAQEEQLLQTTTAMGLLRRETELTKDIMVAELTPAITYFSDIARSKAEDLRDWFASNAGRMESINNSIIESAENAKYAWLEAKGLFGDLRGANREASNAIGTFRDTMLGPNLSKQLNTQTQGGFDWSNVVEQTLNLPPGTFGRWVESGRQREQKRLSVPDPAEIGPTASNMVVSAIKDQTLTMVADNQKLREMLRERWAPNFIITGAELAAGDLDLGFRSQSAEFTRAADIQLNSSTQPTELN